MGALEFIEGKIYSSDVITEALQVGGDGFLLHKDNKVIACRLDPRLNPSAPEVIIAGKGADREKYSKVFSQQKHYVPTFLKKGTNRWEYAGKYRVSEMSNNTSVIRKHKAHRIFDDISNIIFLERNESEEKIARLCWNVNKWVRPSGAEGKSRNKDSYEWENNFGHEEWLFDAGKIVGGYHYGFLQQLSGHYDAFSDTLLDIHLYSIDSRTGDRWWIGRISDVEVVSGAESKKVHQRYLKKGWIDEMVGQLDEVGGCVSAFRKTTPDIFFNMKYKIENLGLFDLPIRFSKDDPAVGSNYYTTLLNKNLEPNLESDIEGQFTFSHGHTRSNHKGKFQYGERKGDVDLLHYEMQDNIHKQLSNAYGKKQVGTENNTGYGTKVDIVVKADDGYIFYELKTANSVKGCIREALSQLLEYVYWPNENRATKMVIVSQNVITDDAGKYLAKLRDEFKIPVYYQRYDVRDKILTDEIY